LQPSITGGCVFLKFSALRQPFYRVDQFLRIIHASRLGAPKLAALDDPNQMVASRVMIKRSLRQTDPLNQMMLAKIIGNRLDRWRNIFHRFHSSVPDDCQFERRHAAASAGGLVLGELVK
jgi:hypothetical protein